MNRKITQKQKDEKRAQALRENLKKRRERINYGDNER